MSGDVRMPCPACGQSLKGSKVVDTRYQLAYVRRRRVCDACGERLTTREAIVPKDDDAHKGGAEERHWAEAVASLAAAVVDLVTRVNIATPVAAQPSARSVEMAKLRKAGKTLREIAEAHGVSKQRVHQVTRGIT